MELQGKRKFIGSIITLGLFFIIMSMVLFFMAYAETTNWDQSTLTGLGIFAGALGGALMAISGAFYLGNGIEHFAKRNENRPN
jgi:hypothetical protein